MKDTEHFSDYWITGRQKAFCDEYLKNGNNAMAAAHAVNLGGIGNRGEKRFQKARYAMTYNILKKPEIKRYLADRMRAVDKKIEYTLEKKATKLAEIAELAVPTGSQTLKGTDPRASIAAIAELNKMFGHYAPEKKVVANIDFNKAVKERVEEIRGEYEREY
jgi:phage terminase small subunit